MGLRYRTITIRFGHMGIVADGGRLRRVYLPELLSDTLYERILCDYPHAREDPELLPELIDDLKRYFAGQPVTFSVPIEYENGGEFTRKAWEACRAIPYGQTVTYKHLAAQAGSPGAARAVGAAMRRNPCPIVIPCHRVLGSNGALVGYSGNGGVSFKRCLIQMESAALARLRGPC